MAASMRAQPPLYCLQAEGDSVPIAVQERMERLAGRLWNDFYDTHRAKFFKDRHWLAREWPELALAGGEGEGEGEGEGGGGVGVVEVGCGVGNAALPLLDVLSAPAPVYACDFSETAIEILRQTPAALRSEGRLRAFVADAAQPGSLLRDSSQSPDFAPIEPHSLAAATLVFALSAMSPAAMAVAVDNVRGVLSENGGRAFVRDYAAGDMASARLAGRSTPRRLNAWIPAAASVAGTEEEKERNSGAASSSRAEAAAALLSGGEFFARGDGTRAFYFSEAGLRRMFESRGFVTEAIGTVHMTKENRATREKMPRKWVQAVFRLGGEKKSSKAGALSSTAAGALSSPRLTRTTATTTTSEATTTSSSSRAEEEEKAAAPSSSTSNKTNRASRYRPEWQDSDDDDGDDEEEGDEKEKRANGDKASSSDDDDEEEEKETARAAARLFRTVLVDSTTSKSATEATETGEGSNTSTLTPLGLDTHIVDVGPPLGTVSFSAAPAELRSTLSHTGLLTWPAAPALARILLDKELAASFSSSSSSSFSLLELGAGGSPLVALAAARSGCGFRRCVSTDGSPRALRLLSANIARNSHLVVAERLRVRLLPWGDAGAAERAVEEAAARKERRGFAVVVGADTLYSVPALPRLMATIAATLDRSSNSCSIAVLCYQERRVRVAEAEAAARGAGLRVIDPAASLPAWRAAAERAGVGEGRLLRLLCLRHTLK